ncbi:hypothetical protein P3L10_004286 [Capsicum annuum]
MRKALPFVLEQKRSGEELAITCLVSGNVDSLEELEGDEGIFCKAFDVYVHVGSYVPALFGIHENAARLAVVGRGRRTANAKYSDWVRQRKQLEKLRPPSVNELLLSNNGDQILEGCLTNLFVVFRKDVNSDYDKASQRYNESTVSIELQTAPVRDGVLPGVLRQVILETYAQEKKSQLEKLHLHGSEREMWLEAFITNSLRLIQHVEVIQAPSSWDSLEAKTWRDVKWEEKLFEHAPGRITMLIEKEIMEMSTI